MRIIGAIAAGLIAVGLLFVLLFIKGPQKRKGRRETQTQSGRSAAGHRLYLPVVLLCDPGKVVKTFSKPGVCLSGLCVVYCFVNTWLNTGISKPDGYSKEEILSIFDKKELGDDNAMLLTQKDEDEKHRTSCFRQNPSSIRIMLPSLPLHRFLPAEPLHTPSALLSCPVPRQNHSRHISGCRTGYAHRVPVVFLFIHSAFPPYDRKTGPCAPATAGGADRPVSFLSLNFHPVQANIRETVLFDIPIFSP